MSALDTLHQSPFTVLTLIAAPAVLTNASSVLALGTSNRFARAVDRQRELSKLLDRDPPITDPEEAVLRVRQLRWSGQRARLLVRALTAFYTSLGAFSAASLSSLVGAIIDLQSQTLSNVAGGIALLIGLVGVSGLVVGTSLLIRETRIALAGLREESAFSERRFAERHPTQSNAGKESPPV